MEQKQSTVLELWPVMQEDFRKFVADRPGWFIGALEKAREKKGTQGWNDVKTVINILQFLKDTEVEY